MSESKSISKIQAMVYFVISPMEGPEYRIYVDEDLQAIGGVHALERNLESQSYWFAHVGQILGNPHPNGATFSDSELAQLPDPHERAWQTGRLNPAFGKSEIEKRAFKGVFQAIQRMLDAWKRNDGQTVDAYALKELKISSQQLMSLTTGLFALQRIHEVLEITVIKFWYDPMWLVKPTPSDLVLAEYSLRVPVQIRWAAAENLISAEVMPAAFC
jgi:hypothetical protein